MKNTFEKLRREKDDASSRLYVMQERQRQADQDRTLLLTAVETERQRLARVTAERAAVGEERAALSAGIEDLTKQYLMNLVGPQPIDDPNHGDRANASGVWSVQMLRGEFPPGGHWSKDIHRDAKGVRSSAVSGPSAPLYHSTGHSAGLGQSPSSRGGERLGQFNSVGAPGAYGSHPMAGGAPPYWTSFGSSSSPPNTSGRSGATTGRGGRDSARRGVAEILRDARRDDALEDATAKADRRERERASYLGSRKADVDFDRYRSRESDGRRGDASRHDSGSRYSDTKRSDRGGGDYGRNDDDGGRRRDREPSPGKKRSGSDRRGGGRDRGGDKEKDKKSDHFETTTEWPSLTTD
eukprot:Selendium_serpulae@DN5807_c4_g2_i2.p1